MYRKMFFITNHSVERYKERIEDDYPSLIIRRLLNAMQTAKIIKRTYRGGKIYYCHIKDRDIFPIVYPPATPKGDWPVITTIITTDTQEGRELKRRAEKLCLIK